MKIRKSETYLVVSSAHLGVSTDILKVFSQVVKTFGAKVFHIGDIESQDEKKQRKSLSEDIKTLNQRMEDFTDSTRESTRDKVYDELNEKEHDLKVVQGEVLDRLRLVQKTLGAVTFILPADSNFPMPADLPAEYDEFVLSKYLMLSAMQPVSDVSTLRPVNRNAIHALKQYGGTFSWIVPHPIPAVVPYPRPGLNNTHNYYSVGSLKTVEQPTTRKNAYIASHSPAAMLVIVDQENGEFHAVHLHVDYVEKKGYRKSKPLVLYDGLCFTVDGVKEVESKDRAVFVSDEHEPFHHSGVLGATRVLNNLFQPYTFINGGDASDCTPVSRHELDKPGSMEGLRISTMLTGLQKLLAAQTECDSIKERILIDSNHAEWLTGFVETFPQLKGLIDWETVAKTYFPDWTVRLRNPDASSMPYKFGDYSVRHGDQESLTKAEHIFDNGKYLCGHFHRHQGVRRMVTVGCGCELNPPYMKHKISDWQNQVTTMTKYSGTTAIAPKIVLHDKARNFSRFVYRNQIYEIVRYYTNRKKS